MSKPVAPDELIQHMDGIRRLARRLALGAADAEDVAQETARIAIESGATRARRRGPWLRGVARNVARGQVRTRRKHERLLERPAATSVPSTADTLAAVETKRAVLMAVQRLREPYRGAVSARYLDGIPPRRLAAQLGVKVPTLKQRLRRGLQMLRDDLDATYGDRQSWLGSLLALKLTGAVGSAAMSKSTWAAVAAIAALLAVGMLVWRPWREVQAPLEKPVVVLAFADEPAPQPPPKTEDAPAAPAVGLAPAAAPTEPAKPAPTTPAGPVVSGRVLDPKGSPVVGARVLLLGESQHRPIPTPIDESDPGSSIRTDADGRFVGAVTETAPFHSIVVRADGFSAHISKGHPPGADVTIQLDLPVSMSGTVRDDMERPVEGARVRALMMLDRLPLMVEVQTDAQGAFRLDGLPAAYGKRSSILTYFPRLSVEIVAEGFAPLLVRQVHPLPPHWDFFLTRGVTMTGRVLDGQSGRPIEGATMALLSIEGGDRRVLSRTRTDVEGRYELENAPSKGRHAIASSTRSREGKTILGAVVAWADGYGANQAKLLALESGSTAEHVIRLWPAVEVRGRVIDDAGAPVDASIAVKVPGRDVNVWHRDPTERRAHHGRTDADGSFVLRGAPGARGSPTPATLSIRPRGERMGLLIHEREMRAIQLVVGEVLDLGDLVVARSRYPMAPVLVRRPDGTPYFGASVARSRSPHGSNSVRTNAQGIAYVPLPNGNESERSLAIRAPGHPIAYTELPSDRSDENPHVVTLRKGHALSGVVHNADGSPADGVRVAVGDGRQPVDAVWPPPPTKRSVQFVPPSGGAFRYGSTITDPKGRFAFSSLPPGPFHVRATRYRRGAQGRRPPLVAFATAVEPGASGLTLRLPADRLPRAGVLVGRVVVAETGKAPALDTLRIALRQDNETVAVAHGSARVIVQRNLRQAVQATGAFRFENLPPGVCTLEVKAAGYTSHTSTVEIASGEETTIPDVALSRGVVVRGRVTVPTGVSLKGRTLAFEGDSDVVTPLAMDGTFRATGLSPGFYRVMCHPLPFERSGSAPLLRTDGGSLHIEVESGEVAFSPTLAPGGTLVLAPEDARLPPGNGDEPTADQARAGREGRIEVLNDADELVYGVTGLVHRRQAGRVSLPPGRYRARLHLPEAPVREEVVVLQVGQYRRVTFTDD